MVRQAKEHIAAGDIYQVVLSQRFSAAVGVDPFTVYRALRHVNPSPYMFFVRMGDRCIVGSSPEMLVRVEGRNAVTHPIAGTRPRGKTDEEDQRLADELKRNEKERAEHVMLVDLGRNDLGRGLRLRQRARADLHGARALLARHAPGVGGRREAGRRSRPARRAGRVFPGRHRVGRAESARDADHQRASRPRRAASTPAPSAISTSPAISTSASPSAPSCSNAVRPRSRPAPASSPTRIRPPSTKKPATKPARWCGRWNSRSEACDCAATSHVALGLRTVARTSHFARTSHSHFARTSHFALRTSHFQ